MSQAEFARLHGVSSKTVGSWIKNDKIQAEQRMPIDSEANHELAKGLVSRNKKYLNFEYRKDFLEHVKKNPVDNLDTRGMKPKQIKILNYNYLQLIAPYAQK